MSDARTRILRRRAALVAAAMAGAGITASSCGSSVCLSIAVEGGPAMDAPADMGPQVCLTAPIDSGVDTGADSPSDSPNDAPNDQEAG